ncbi:hypothetical protein ACTIVE_9254 [Actinomadura verrucosospora]|uniref:Uncharacterized protein n=1 Tax=Actinomadura verrucosospora TaxID=46165 RepID=A0A7D3W280_ACTVE|nr:hypothetical protein ACTIVE_9254 [Actinomadura verrucosospora]
MIRGSALMGPPWGRSQVLGPVVPRGSHAKSPARLTCGATFGRPERLLPSGDDGGTSAPRPFAGPIPTGLSAGQVGGGLRLSARRARPHRSRAQGRSATNTTTCGACARPAGSASAAGYADRSNPAGRLRIPACGAGAAYGRVTEPRPAVFDLGK